MLDEAHRLSLVDLARRAIEARVHGRSTPAISSEFPRASGVFVTVKVGGELRGCLGTLACPGDLGREVARCAGDAASKDERFPALTAGELSTMTIQVSVLGPLELIDPAETGALTVGVHGLVVEQGRRKGVLLPQVAAERAWSAEQFVRQTCVKAGLAPDAWRHGATVHRFAADVFGDD